MRGKIKEDPFNIGHFDCNCKKLLPMFDEPRTKRAKLTSVPKDVEKNSQLKQVVVNHEQHATTT
jgi:hypothetical protein